MRNFSTAETNILNDLNIDLDRGRLADKSPEPTRQPRRGGILPDLDISISDEGQMVVNDNKIVDDPNASDPYSAQGRKPAAPAPYGGSFDIEARAREHLLSGALPGDPYEFEQYLSAMAKLIAKMRKGGPGVQLSLNRNPKGVWSGGFGRAYGRVVAMGLADERESPEENERMEEYRGEKKRSGDDVAAVLQSVLDNLNTDMNFAEENGVPTPGSEAAGLLRTMIGQLILTRKRRADQKPKDTDRDDAAESNVGDDFGKAYREASPAFAAMGLQRAQRPQSDAEAEALVDKLFAKKRFVPTA
jgi:hypothetical protein